ncbi:MAG: EAL domain-containing protein [Coleofasciculus sp. Co-bin14]|nr:EAL domain-containing protein [Coleofasciculus sp. Co-bin14]
MLQEHWTLGTLELSGFRLSYSLLIGLFYYSVSILLFYFGRQQRDLPYAGLSMIAGVFPMASGTTYVLDALTLGLPNFSLTGETKTIADAMTLLAVLLSLLLLLTIWVRSRSAGEELRLLQSLTQAISESPDFHSALSVALGQICERTRWDYGEAWVPRLDHTVLESSSAWYGNSITLERFRQASEKLTFSPNIGLPGRVWSSRQPEWIEDISAQPDACFIYPQAQGVELKAGFGVPILLDDRVLAVLTFFSTQSRTQDKRYLQLVAAMATQLGLVFGRKQLQEELLALREKCYAIVEDQTELICRFTPDGTLTYVNDAYCRYFGKTREELLASSLFNLIPDEYREKTKKHIARLSLKNRVAPREYRIAMPNGDIKWQQWTDKVIIGQDGQIVEFQSVGRDITERRLSEQESARLASIALLSPTPIIETDLVGQVRYLNPEAMRLLPDLQEMGAEHPFLVGLRSLTTILQGEGSLKREVKIDEVYYEQVLHYLPEIECLRIYAFDITERKHAEEQLIHNAFYDQLTGLANRALFMDRLKQAVQRAKQSRRRNSGNQSDLFAVLCLDLNRFKLVNNSLGNQIGDQLLQEFADRLQSCLRPSDTVARLGGDEFAILLEGIHEVSDATRVAESIHQTLTSPFYLNQNEVFMTLSIGITLNTTSEEQPEELLRDAGIAMYRAKAQGKSCYELFDAAMHELTVDRLQIEIDLRRAIERQEFLVYYQPIVLLSTGKITGFEALIRWYHPQRGLISPMEFIPTAEETGLIAPIGWWTLREACRQLKIWQEQFPAVRPLTMNVNLSCKQFTEPDLLEQIDSVLQEIQPAVGSVKLEITESVVMENPDLVKDLLLELKKRNIHLCIDDFGTGYSSLSRLQNFPISTLKIDRSFVSQIGALGENSEVIKAIVTLARTLKMDVVAEGIEASEQILSLIALECDYGQGNFFSKAVNSEVASSLLIAESFLGRMNTA